MLDAAFIALLLAGAIGATLAALFLRQGEAESDAAPASMRAEATGILHGTLGAVGVLLLLVAMQDGAVHAAVGLAGFPAIASWLLGLALLAGLAVLGASVADPEGRRRGRRGILIAIHASLAISGLVVLLALIGLG